MLDLLPVGTWHELHTPGDLVGGRHREPGGCDIGRVEPPISGILMPGDEPWIMGLLDEEPGIPAEDVRPQQIFDRIENLRMTDHLVDPGAENVAAMAATSTTTSESPSLIFTGIAGVSRATTQLRWTAPRLSPAPRERGFERRPGQQVRPDHPAAAPAMLRRGQGQTVRPAR